MTARLSPLDALGEAVRFLTILPWPGTPTSDPARLGRAASAFPVVGLLIGISAAAAGLACERLFDSPLHALAAVAASTAITGALHLDGLADSADALFSWRSREKKLEILRDSRIGTMGSLALFFALATKLGALVALGPSWSTGALLAPVWGRWSALYGIVIFPAARPDGVGAAVRAHVRTRGFLGATLLAIALGGLLLPPTGALIGLLVFALAHGAGSAMTRSLGGLTGDTYGALGEIAEVTTLLALAALNRHAWI